MSKILLRLTDEIQEATARRGRHRKKGRHRDTGRPRSQDRYRGRSPVVDSETEAEFRQKCLPRLRDEDAEDVKIFIRVCLEEANESTVVKFVVPILSKKDCIDWKNRADIIVDILQTILLHGSKPYNINEADDEFGGFSDSNSRDTYRKYPEELKDVLLRIIRNYGLYSIVSSHLYDVIYTGTQVYVGRGDEELPIVEFAQNLMSQFPWRDHPQEANNLLNLITQKVKEKPIGYVWNICTEAVREIGQEHGAQFQTDINEAMSTLFRMCMHSPWYCKNGEPSYTIKILEEIMNQYLYSTKSAKNLAPFIEDVKKIWASNEPRLGSYAENVIITTCDNFELMGGKMTKKLIDLVLTGEKTRILNNLSKMYPKCPQYFHQRFDEFIYALKVSSSNNQNTLLQLLWNIAKLHPKEYSPKAISVIAEMMLDNGDNVHMIFQIFNALAEFDPSEVFCHVDKLKQAIDNMGENGFSGIPIFLPLSRGDEDRAYACLEYLNLKITSFSMTYRPTLIHHLRSIGVEWPHLLAEYEAVFVKLSREPALRDACKSALDIIQGRSLEAVTNVVTEQQSNIEDLDSRLVITGDNLENIAKEMDARPKVTPRTSIKAKDDEKGLNSRLLMQVLEKLGEMNDTILHVDLKVKNMDKRLKSVEKQVVGISALLSTDV